MAAKPASSDTIICGPEGLRALVASIFSACGCNAEEAGEIAERLTLANLTGHDSHGVVQVPRYVAGVRAGEVAVNRMPEVIAEGGPWLHLDAGFGFGQRAGAIATAARASPGRASMASA
ncbi:MAG: Ldh family oxidoreductase [Rhodovibrio sp.]|nr:Ldh family oxidoreductase [Rhodovibrio sp.]